jgi:nitrite reductase (cytochrome c-552)
MKRFFTRTSLIYGLVFFGAVLLAVGITALLINISERRSEAEQYPLMLVEVGENELDPEIWGRNFPVHYDRFMMTQQDYGETPYGGSTPYSKLERYPAMIRLWAGYAFSIDHNEERGHYYAQIDQQQTERVQVVSQPGACINCHSANATLLIEEMGWEEFNSAPYNDLVEELHYGSSCADCHNPETMALRITRPALINALEQRGIDVTQATRQEMRTYVCAQCHVEYYFLGEDKVLTFPWSQGYTIDDIESHYDRYGFRDWVHAETGAPMIKIQHPEYEMYTTSTHFSSGVTCADCHMPFIREGGIKISDHWIRSPLTNLNNACQTCHNIPEAELEARISTIQDRTAGLLRDSEEALIDAIDAIVLAKDAGAEDADLAEAYQFHRAASLRWDFVSSENSTGFHSPQESARVLADSINYARQAQLSAVQALHSIQAGEAEANASTDEETDDS